MIEDAWAALLQACDRVAYTPDRWPVGYTETRRVESRAGVLGPLYRGVSAAGVTPWLTSAEHARNWPCR